MVGLAIASTGLLVALFPMISIWRVSSEVLDELPEIPASSIEDDHRRFAIADPEFVLATRSYQGTSSDDVERALLANGFAPTSGRDGRWLYKDCCGEYDAVWVRVNKSGAESSVAVLTAADSDLQTSWPFFAFTGLLVTLTALTGIWRPRLGPIAEPSSASASTSSQQL